MSYCDLIDPKYTLTTAFMFKCVISTPEELDTLENCQDGDVVMISSTSQIYCHIGDGWEIISSYEDNPTDSKQIKECLDNNAKTLVERKCNNCGAPLIRISHNKFHCEYCGSTYYTK